VEKAAEVVTDAGIAHCGRRFDQEAVELIIDVARRFARLSRTELAATVCELLGWRRKNGGLKTRECLDLLCRLEGRGLISLPPLRPGRPRGRPTRVALTEGGRRQPAVSGRLGDVAPVSLEQVRGPEAQALWRELVERYHYLGHATPFGAQLRYFIRIGESRQAIVGCLQYSSAAWRISVRDRWIGWEERRRVEKLGAVVQQSRFLLLPWVQVRYLASHVLALSVRHLAADWGQHYGVRPLLVETLVETERYRGTSYRAANWIDCGLTAGTGRTDRGGKRRPKRVFVYPLDPRARELLAGVSRCDASNHGDGGAADGTEELHSH
jgi:hypothetical protein